MSEDTNTVDEVVDEALIPNVADEQDMPKPYTKHDSTPLTAHDRCDGCGAQAYGEAEINGTRLLFCGHHLNKYLERLLEVSTSVDDYTKVLDEAGMTSANV